MRWFAALKNKADRLKAETWALCLAARDPRTPWYARLLVAGIAAYALSPIDLVPDFIPIIGYLDDLVLLPLGITLAIRCVPGKVMAQCRIQALADFEQGNRAGRIAGAVVILVWFLAAACFALFVRSALAP